MSYYFPLSHLQVHKILNNFQLQLQSAISITQRIFHKKIQSILGIVVLFERLTGSCLGKIVGSVKFVSGTCSYSLQTSAETSPGHLDKHSI